VSLVETTFVVKNILKSKIFFLPTDPNILEHVSGNTEVFFLGLKKKKLEWNADLCKKKYIVETGKIVIPTNAHSHRHAL
jgi:hypothetical protein